MARLACVALPEFPLQLLLQRHPQWRTLPAAVVDRDKAQGVLLWVNEAARCMSILPGMRYAAGLALAPQLRAGEVSETELGSSITSIVEKLNFYTAEVEPSEHEPGVFWLNASGLSLLYPSLRRWSDLISSELKNAGYTATIVVGFSRFGTYANAKNTGDTVVFATAADEFKQTECVRIDRLGFDPQLRDTLCKLGITTIGGFLQLPANGIKKRFGADAHRLYQLARDELFAPLTPQIPQLPIKSLLHLDYPESNLERLMAVIERQLGSLFIQLNERNEVLATVVIRLGFDNGEKIRETLQPASPTLDLKQIVGLIQLRLGSLQLSSGINDIEVEIEGRSALQKQGELFADRSSRDLQAATRAFARIRAEFGDQTVVKAVLREGHLPEASFAWEPIRTLVPARPRNVRLPPLVRRIYSRPAIFSPSQQRNADKQLTSYIDDGTVRETHGPYMVTGGWWQREVQREYYFVTTSNGRSLWMYYDRRRLCWYIHGEVE